MNSAIIIIDVLNVDRSTENLIANNIVNYCHSAEDVKLIVILTSGQSGISTVEKESYKIQIGLPHIKEHPIWANSNHIYSSADNDVIKSDWECFNNYKKFFNEWATSYDDDNRTRQGELPFVRSSRSRLVGTHSTILNMQLRTDQTLVGCWSISQLKYLIEDYSKYQIENLIYAGGALSVCLADRTIGYNKVLAKMQDNYFQTVNTIIANRELIFSVTGVPAEDHEFDPVQWQKLDSTRYKLIL